jgi:hypothetical protein
MGKKEDTFLWLSAILVSSEQYKVPGENVDRHSLLLKTLYALVKQIFVECL